VKISELIEILKDRKQEHGDLDVIVDATAGHGLHEIEDIDVDTDDTGLIIWIGGGI
jgi:hypothetical protein